MLRTNTLKLYNLTILLIPQISGLCSMGRHSECPIQQPQDFDYPNCQCEGSAEGKISPSNM